MDILWKYSEIIIKVHAITPTSTSGSININPWSLSRAFDKSSLFKMSAQNKSCIRFVFHKQWWKSYLALLQTNMRVEEFRIYWNSDIL